ncbi:hypothetical protein F5Y01DRAFT_16897 [Xylaria sp. FL0043]|nr:hypothetical protein F5Y01DRAFT_16897 [Xylaria sp. FL0043]
MHSTTREVDWRIANSLENASDLLRSFISDSVLRNRSCVSGGSVRVQYLRILTVDFVVSFVSIPSLRFSYGGRVGGLCTLRPVETLLTIFGELYSPLHEPLSPTFGPDVDQDEPSHISIKAVACGQSSPGTILIISRCGRRTAAAPVQRDAPGPLGLTVEPQVGVEAFTASDESRPPDGLGSVDPLHDSQSDPDLGRDDDSCHPFQLPEHHVEAGLLRKVRQPFPRVPTRVDLALTRDVQVDALVRADQEHRKAAPDDVDRATLSRGRDPADELVLSGCCCIVRCGHFEFAQATTLCAAPLRCDAVCDLR